MEHLDRDHASFRSSDAELRLAERAILGAGLRCASQLRLEFDAVRLRTLIGEDMFSKLTSGYEPSAARGWRYDVHDVSLDNERRKLVLELLAPERPWESEAPTNCVRSIRLLDPSGHTLVRGGDHLTFFLLDLPTKDRQDLADALQHLGLPDDVVEQVNIDVAQLEP